jgi:hypothetical protein
MAPCVPNPDSCEIDLSEYQLEDIVVDEVASSTIWKKLKGLAVIHRALLIVDLYSA